MVTFNTILGIFAIIISLIAYIPYFRDIFKGKTKPHAYTWLVWSILTAIAFVAQILDGAGAGAWITAVISVVSITIFVLALNRGEKNITKSDKLSLAAAFIALLLWWLTSSPLTSIILITLVDFFAFYPNIRKSYHKPMEETLSTYLLDGIAFVFAVIALENFSIISALYPVALVFLNLGFVLFLMIRRKK